MNKLIKLSELKNGEHAIIYKLYLEGDVRRRFLDMGIIEEAQIKRMFSSPFSDPVAYITKGALISIRNCDAQKILVINKGE